MRSKRRGLFQALEKALRLKGYPQAEVTHVYRLSHDPATGMGQYAVRVKNAKGGTATHVFRLHRDVVGRALEHPSNDKGVGISRHNPYQARNPYAEWEVQRGNPRKQGVDTQDTAAIARRALGRGDYETAFHVARLGMPHAATSGEQKTLYALGMKARMGFDPAYAQLIRTARQGVGRATAGKQAPIEAQAAPKPSVTPAPSPATARPTQPTAAASPAAPAKPAGPDWDQLFFRLNPSDSIRVRSGVQGGRYQAAFEHPEPVQAAREAAAKLRKELGEEYHVRVHAIGGKQSSARRISVHAPGVAEPHQVHFYAPGTAKALRARNLGHEQGYLIPLQGKPISFKGMHEEYFREHPELREAGHVQARRWRSPVQGYSSDRYTYMLPGDTPEHFKVAQDHYLQVSHEGDAQPRVYVYHGNPYTERRLNPDGETDGLYPIAFKPDADEPDWHHTYRQKLAQEKQMLAREKMGKALRLRNPFATDPEEEGHEVWVAGRNGRFYKARYRPQSREIEIVEEGVEKSLLRSFPLDPDWLLSRMLIKGGGAAHFSHKEIQEMGLRWITVHPNGPHGEGVPVLVHDDGEHYTVVGGAHGRLNQMVLKKPKGDKEQDRQEAKARGEKVKPAPKPQEIDEKFAAQQKEKISTVKGEIKSQAGELQQMVSDIFGQELNIDRLLPALQAASEEKAREEHPQATPEEIAEFAQQNVKAAKANAKQEIAEAQAQVLVQAQEAEAMAAMQQGVEDPEVSPKEFKVRLSGRTLVKQMTPEQVREVLKAKHNLTDLTRVKRALERSLKVGKEKAVEGFELRMARREVTDAELREWAKEGYLSRQSTLANAALVRGSKEASAQAQATHQSSGAVDTLNTFAASQTGKAILSSALVKKLGVENAARVAAVYLQERGGGSKEDGERLRDEIAEHGWLEAGAAVMKAHEATDLVSLTRKQAEVGDGAVTPQAVSIMALNMAQVKYRLLNTAEGKLRAAQALAQHLVAPMTAPMEVSGGSNAIAAHKEAKGLGLGRGDYRVQKADDGYVIQVQPKAIGKLAKERSLQDAQRSGAMDQIREGAREAYAAQEAMKAGVPDAGPTYQVPGMNPEVQWKGPHQIEGIDSLRRLKKMAILHGAGCIAPDTLIEDPVAREVLPVAEWMERGEEMHVWALSRTGEKVIARASCPFVKAYEPMHLVTTSTGEQITVAAGHRFLTPEGWKPLRDVPLGSLVAVQGTANAPRTVCAGAHPWADRHADGSRQPSSGAAPGLSHAPGSSPERVLPPLGCDASRPQSTEGTSLSTRSADGKSSSRTTPGSPGSCSGGRRLYGELLPGEVDASRGPVPSPAGAHGRIRHDSHGDDLGTRQGHTLSCQASSLPSKPRSERQADPRSSDLGECLCSCGRSGQPSGRHSGLLQSDCLPIPGQPIRGSVLRDAPGETFSACASSTSANHYNMEWAAVERVEMLPADLVFDLEVYEHHNYLAHGFWNHNSGKTAQMLGAGAALLLTSLNEDGSEVLDNEGKSVPQCSKGIITMPKSPRGQQNPYWDPDKEQWDEGEIRRFLAPEVQEHFVVVKDGDHLKRLIKKGTGGKVLVMSPELAREHSQRLKDDGFGQKDTFFMADEAHELAVGMGEKGSQKARVTQDLVRGSGVSGLFTGSPIEKNASEMWSLIDMLHPGSLGSQREFTKEWQRLAHSGGHVLGDEARQRMDDRISGVVTSYFEDPMRQDDDGNPVPVKMEQRTVNVPMTAYQRKKIAAINKQYARERQSDDKDVRKGATFARERRIADVLKKGSADPKAQDYNPKLAKLQEIMEEEKARDPHNRMLVYSPNLNPLASAEKALASYGDTVRISGSEDDQQRRAARNAFNDRENGVAALMVSKAGYTGVNAQGGDHVVHLQPAATPSEKDQTDARVKRIGQKRDVRSTTLVSEHPQEQVARFRSERIRRPEHELLMALAGREDESGRADLLLNHLHILEQEAGLKGAA